ncbi:MAG: hypothetical protein ACQKBV_06685 [Puniceicoccales bacterium]
MNLTCKTLLLLAAMHVIPLPAARVESVYFPTGETFPVFEVPPSMQREYNLFRASLPYLPEAAVIMAVLTFGDQATDVTSDQQKMLRETFLYTYDKIAEDPELAAIGHTLDYSFSDVSQTQGHYFAVIPEVLSESTNTIVFLHGFGGNFLFYTWLLKNDFPDAVIISSYSPSCRRVLG